MTEELHLPEAECARAQALLPLLVDSDLPAGQSEWLRGHLEACAECRLAQTRLLAMDLELTACGRHLEEQNPPPAVARAQLTASMAAAPSPARALRWMPAVAAAIAAAVVLVTVVPRQKPVAHAGLPGFVEIPYLPPLDPHENTTIVRMDVSVATLIAVGYRITADPNAMVPADVLVGEDGRAHAVRVLTDIDWNGIGD